MKKDPLSQLERALALVLAMVFLLAGLFALVAGTVKQAWLVALVGLAAIWWGTVWGRVAYKGRRLASGELFWPFWRT